MIPKRQLTTFVLSTILVLTALSFISSQNETIATPEDISDAGITPDNAFLWGFDRAIESMTELFSEKPKLAHARERLAEVKVMIQENKADKAMDAVDSFNKLLQRVHNKTMLKEHKALIDNLGQKISAIASQKGKLSEQQKTDIKALIIEHKERIKTEVIEQEGEDEEENETAQS